MRGVRGVERGMGRRRNSRKQRRHGETSGDIRRSECCCWYRGDLPDQYEGVPKLKTLVRSMRGCPEAQKTTEDLNNEEPGMYSPPECQVRVFTLETLPTNIRVID